MAGSAQTESESLCVKERDSPERQELEEKAEEEEEEKEDQTSSPAAPNTYTRDKTCDVTEVRAPEFTCSCSSTGKRCLGADEAGAAPRRVWMRVS